MTCLWRASESLALSDTPFHVAHRLSQLPRFPNIAPDRFYSVAESYVYFTRWLASRFASDPSLRPFPNATIESNLSVALSTLVKATQLSGRVDQHSLPPKTFNLLDDFQHVEYEVVANNDRSWGSSSPKYLLPYAARQLFLSNLQAIFKSSAPPFSSSIRQAWDRLQEDQKQTILENGFVIDFPS